MARSEIGGSAPKKKKKQEYAIAPVPMITPAGQDPSKAQRKRAEEQRKSYEYTSRANGGGSHTYSASPNYYKPAAPPKIQKPTWEPPKPQDEDLGAFMQRLRDNAASNHAKETKPFGAESKQEWNFLRETTEQKDRLQPILDALVNPVAPKGVEPKTPDFLKKRNPNIFDDELIEQNLSDFEPGSYQYKNALNDILGQQLSARSEWLTNRNRRRADEAKKVYEEAAAAAREGDYDYLSRYTKEHPNFKLDGTPYRAEFGISEKDIWNQWLEQRENVPQDQRQYARSRVDDLTGHYRYMASNYKFTNNAINRAKANYKKKYQDSIKYHSERGTNAEKEAAAKAGGAFPTKGGGKSTSSESLAMYDRLAGYNKADYRDKEVRSAALADVRKRLGVKKLPTVEQMLTYKVRAGELDPRDDNAMMDWIDRFNNPNHPETMGLYAAWAKKSGTKVSDDDLGKFVNDPIKSGLERVYKDMEKDKKKSDEKEDLENTGFFDGVRDVTEGFGGLLAESLWKGEHSPGKVISGAVGKIPIDDNGLALDGVGGLHDEEGNELTNVKIKDLAGTAELGWAIDKLSRPLYTIAGIADAWYGLDQDPTDDPRTWSEKSTGSKILEALGVTGLANVVLGAPKSEAADTAAADPVGALKSMGDAAYQQFFRGSNLPGIDDQTVPSTFSKLIATNAFRDPEDNIYDDAWYQTAVGLGFDIGADPLNFLGVGAVKGTLNVPKRALEAENLGDSAKAYYDVQKELLGPKQFRPDMSPQAEKAWRVQESLNRLGEAEGSVKYVSDEAMFGRSIQPVGRLSEMATSNKVYLPTPQHVNVQKELRALDEQTSKVINDVGSLAFFDKTIKVLEKNGIEGVPYTGDLRVNKLLGELKGKGYRYTTLLNDFARKAGYSEVRMDPSTPGGLKAQGLKDEADRLESEVHDFRVRSGGGAELGSDGLRMGDTLDDSYGPQIDKNRAEVERLADDDKVTGVYRVTQTDRYLDEGNPLPTGFKPADEFRKAMGWDKSKHGEFPFSDRDVSKALVEGNRIALRDDPTMRIHFRKLQERLSRYEAKAANPKLSAAAKQRNIKNRDQALQALNGLTYSNALRYMDVLYDLKRTGMAFSDSDRARALVMTKRQIDAERASLIGGDGQSYTGLKGEGRTDYEDPESLADIYRDYDFVENDMSYADMTAPVEGAMSREHQLSAMSREIDRQIKALRLDRDGKITGLPPQVAHDVGELIPPYLRNEQGKIDEKKLKKIFTIDAEDFSIHYAKAPDAAGNHFAEIMRGAMEAEYIDTYDEIYRQRWIDKRGADPKAHVNHKTTNVDAFYSKYGDRVPEVGDPIRPVGNYRNTAWGKLNRDGFDNPQHLAQESMESAEAMFDTLFAKGAPFKFKLPFKVEYNGKVIPKDYPSGIRKYLEDTYKLSDDAVDEVMKDAASKMHDHLTSFLGDQANYIEDAVSEVSGPLGNDLLAVEDINKFFNNTWNASIQRRVQDWKTKHGVAKSADNKAHQRRVKNVEAKNFDPSQDTLLSPSEKAAVKQQAFKRVRDAIINDVVENQTVRRNWGNERLTINEHARLALKEFRGEITVRRNEVLDQIEDAQKAKVGAEVISKYSEQLKGLDRSLKDGIRSIEAARQEAHAARQAMKKRAAEERLLEMLSMPTRMEGKMLQLRIMGMRKNLQWTNGLFKAAEDIAQLVPARMHEQFMGYAVRPTKQLDAHEAVLYRAMHENQSPAIIHAILSRLSLNMGKMTEAERVGVMNAFREGRKYEGTKRDMAVGIETELRDIENIWNGKDEFYQFNHGVLGKNEQNVVTVWEINNFLPASHKVNLKYLHRSINYPGRGKNAGIITVDDLLKAMPRKSAANDPFDFAWHMKLAATQARQKRAIQHSMRNTFGVNVPEEYATLVPKFKSLGWEEIPELGGEFLFPPESVKDMRKLLEFMDPKSPETTKFLQDMDTILGYWKQGMTIYNPGFYTRNGIGEVMTAWLDGVSDPKYYRHSLKVVRYMKGTDQDLAALVKKWSALDGKIPVNATNKNEVLITLKGGTKVTVEEVLRQYIRTGMKSTLTNTDIKHGLRGLAKEHLHDNSLIRKKDAISNKVQDFGEGFEDWLRMGHFIHAMEHSGFGDIGRAAEYAAQRVTRSHFDYTDFSTFEKSVMLRAFPFYKWVRRGAPLMIAHLFLTPGKMTALPKVMNAMSNLSTGDIREDDNGFLPNYEGIAPAWVRDLFSYQMGDVDPEDEYADYLRIATPQIDGLNAIFNPLQQARTLMNPLAKAGLELGGNQNLDPNMPFQILGGDYNEKIGMSPLESLIEYGAKNINPVIGQLARQSRNGLLWEPLPNMGNAKEFDEDYSPGKAWASLATGLGFYQAKLGDPLPAVGNPEVNAELLFSGRQTGSSQESPDQSANPENLIGDLIARMNGGGSEGSGWKNYGNGWRNFGGGGWRNFGNGGGYGGSSGGSGVDLSIWELLKQMQRNMDHGDVTND